jgi:nitrite reductase (NADH) large subunit
MRYVILGSSAAGAQAAEELRKIDQGSEITIISEEPIAPYSRCLLPKFIDGRLTRGQLYFKTDHFYKDYDLTAILGVKAIKVDRNAKNIITDNGQKFDYDRLLIATGSRPFIPKVNGVDLKGVTPCYTLKDALFIMESAKRSKQAVIVGAGFVGLEAAYALAKLGLKAAVIERCSQILPNQLDITASQILQEDLESIGVRIILDESLSAINGASEVEEAIVGDKLHLGCQTVIMATGIKANIELAAENGLDAKRAIIVDEYLRTSDPNIYAAGDCIEIDDIASGKRAVSATWFNAVMQGAFAAINMAGGRRRYTGSVGIQNSIQFHEIPAISYGKTFISAEEQEDYTSMSLHIREKKIYKKLVLKGNKLCGMIFVGDISRAGFYAALVRNETDVSSARDKLLDQDFSPAIFKEDKSNEYDPYQVSAWTKE